MSRIFTLKRRKVALDLLASQPTKLTLNWLKNIHALALLENPAFLVGWIMALWGAGKIFASVITPIAVNKLKRYFLDESSIFICFLAITFLLFLGVFWSNSLWIILSFSFLAGIFDAATETVYYAILQHSPEGLATDRYQYIVFY